MKANILKDVTDYMDFLRGCGYNISLSCFENRFEIVLYKFKYSE